MRCRSARRGSQQESVCGTDPAVPQVTAGDPAQDKSRSNCINNDFKRSCLICKCCGKHIDTAYSGLIMYALSISPLAINTKNGSRIEEITGEAESFQIIHGLNH